MSAITTIIPLGSETSDAEAFRLSSMLGMWVIEKNGQKRLASHPVKGWRSTKCAMSADALNLLDDPGI